jgi:hypothetical protein
VRFLVDQDVYELTVRHLRESGHDVLKVAAIGLARGDDLELLTAAARELKVHGFDDRELRQLVEYSDGRVFSFPGSPGYKLFDFVTEEEFSECASLQHQAERMLARYSRYHARHHRGK